MTDLELLRVQAEGALDGLYGVVVASAADEEALWIGADVPAEAARALAAALTDTPASTLARCRQILDGGDALPLRHGPSFLIAGARPFASRALITRSDRSRGDELRGANPGNWHPVEWDELLDGRLGPWAIASDGARVVSICHTPRPATARAAECGVWTDPAFRGRGLAAATTAAWAEILRPSGRQLFYSTDADNRSSQRVAERLGLRPLGFTWRLGRARNDGNRLHPLCSLY